MRPDFRRLLTGLLLSLLAGCSNGATGPQSLPALALERAFPGIPLASPVLLLQAPARPDRWYVVERAGRVLRFADDPGASRADVVIDLRERVDTAGEGGLLGMAFHPDFAANGRVFLSYTVDGRAPGSPLESRIARFTSRDGGDTLDPASERIVLRLDQPYANHNGGHVAFGPDGMLYAGFGDGGAAGDPRGHGQDTGTLLGAMLRLDVDAAEPYAIPPDNPFAGGGGRGEIFAWGLRNPWRWSFDRETGTLWAGDVGQNAWEEIDRVERGGNYGWNVREGTHCYRADGCRTAGLTDPVVEYGHDAGCSVTGGYVYRGETIPALRGVYLYGDFCSGLVWGWPTAGGGPAERLVDTGISLVSFAEGLDGELFAIDIGGGLYRLRAR